VSVAARYAVAGVSQNLLGAKLKKTEWTDVLNQRVFT